MIFYYEPIISIDPVSGQPHMIMSPEITVRLIGKSSSGSYRALVDTGADNTVLPRSIADDLGIDLAPTSGPAASAFGGQQLKMHVGQLDIELSAEGEACRWTTPVLFFDFDDSSDEVLVLGHAGFLDYFTAEFDGQEAMLTLVPNDDLPPTSA